MFVFAERAVANGRAYEIMLLRDQYENSFSAIAEVYGISSARARQSYHKTKAKQAFLYANHIAVVLGYKNSAPIIKVFHSAYECYQDLAYACAYLEKEYADALTEYRDGEPGIPRAFVKKLPPFREEITGGEIKRVVSRRETEHATFRQIAETLDVTPEKAEKIYDHFYLEKVAAMVKALRAEAENEEEQRTIWDRCYCKNLSSKKRYEMLCADYPRKDI